MRGNNPKKVLKKFQELSKQYRIESVMGNHDEAYLYGREISGSSLESLDAHLKIEKNNLEFFEENKDGSFGRQEFVDSKNNIICVHGGPLDPKKITSKDVGDSWLYQKTWQRLTEENSEFFSITGYHYKALSAFSEVKTLLENFIIFCGHQHTEMVIEQSGGNIQELLSKIRSKQETISDFILKRKDIPLEDKKNYIIRVGLGGPEGYYGTEMSKPHFGIANYDSKMVQLFSVSLK